MPFAPYFWAMLLFIRFRPENCTELDAWASNTVQFSYILPKDKLAMYEIKGEMYGIKRTDIRDVFATLLLEAFLYKIA